MSRHCQDSVKEISCQGRMNQMTMYDELKCPEEQSSTITSTETTTVDVSTTEETRPEVIIKNPQKMLEDVFNDVETNIEIDSNRLDLADAKKELEMMMGDQPAADVEDKKTLLKLPEKKEVFAKKSKSGKKEKSKEIHDDEPMMGDAPNLEEAHDEQHSTTERQRRDAEDTTIPSTEVQSSTQLIDETTMSEESSTSTSTPELTTEVQQITSVITEETTTKNIVQGHPLFHNHAIFKEPISVDNNNGNFERKDKSNSDDHFIPPMLLVKTRFTATKATEGAIEETKEMTTDASTSIITESTPMDGQTVTVPSDDDKNVTSNATENNEISTNEIASVTQLETAPAVNLGEKPILIEKRNDPRMGLNVAATSTLTASPSTTDEPTTTFTEEASSSISYESSVSEISTTDSATETSETSESSSSEVVTKIFLEASTTAQPEKTAEKVIESTTLTEKVETSSAAIVTPMAIKLTTLKAPEIPTTVKAHKSTTQMTNDILNDSPSHESSEEDESHEEGHEHHPKNNFDGQDEEPYRPNRHRGQIGQHQRSGLKTKLGKIIG